MTRDARERPHWPDNEGANEWVAAPDPIEAPAPRRGLPDWVGLAAIVAVLMFWSAVLGFLLGLFW